MGRTLKGGKLITFEGAEGSGKSTLIRFSLEVLKSWGYRVELFREPGGASISEKIRQVILDRSNCGMSVECELLLYLAARAELVREKILPALHDGKIVILDRYEDSTFVYQGYAGGLDLDEVKRLNRWATGGLSPDLTFVFDVDVRTGLSRGGRHDRMELKSLAFHNRVRQGFLRLARENPRRIVLVKDERDISIKKEKVLRKLKHVFGRSYRAR